MNKKYKTILIAAGTILLLATMAIGAVMVYATHGSSVIDLTTLNASVMHNGAEFLQSGSGAGTGTWNPFLTYNVPGSDPDEKGYNSDGPAQFDEFYGGGRTHPIQLAAIPTVEIGGITYREFGLDSNDTGRDDYMSIDEFKVFVDNQSNLDSYNEGTELFGNDDDANKDKVFDMDDNCGADPGCTVFMRSQGLSSGSGVSDIIIRVPDTVFGSFPDCYYGSLTCGQYVYVWSAMGYTVGDPLPDGIDQNWNTNAGFEEWQTREAPVVNVSKTADTSYTQDYDWTVDKKVKVDGTCEDSASIDLFTGESQDAEWCIEVTRTTGDQSDQTVFGDITIFNPTGGEVIPDAIDAEITSITDVISSADFSDIGATVDCGVSFPYTLGAGETLVCTYSEATPDADNETTGTNTATVVVTDAGTDFEAMAPFDFANTDPGNITETNASATLTDDEGPLDELFTNSGSTSYVNNYACDADEGEISNTAVITPSDGGTPDDDTATLTLGCYDLSVSKDATTTFTRTYEWDITKSVTPETWDLFSGETGTSRYTVSVDKTGSTDSSFAVSGDITIANSHPTRAADLTQVRDFIGGGVGEVSVDCGGASSVPALGNLVCSYDSILPDSDPRLNDAVATQQLYDFDTEGSPTADGTMDYNGTANVVFDLETPTSEVNAQVNVTDTNGESWGPVSDDTSWNYTRDFTCDGDEGTHDNTATITETGQNDSASVTVNCYDLSVSKDAQTSLTRTYKWTIEKVVDNPGPIELNPGESVDLDYTVTVDLDEPPFVDSEWAVSGDIMISNSHPTRAAELTNVVDEISGIGSVSVDCGGATSVPADSDLTCSYSSSLPDATSRTNTATATQQLYDFAYDLTPTADGTKDYSGNHAIDFSGATVNEIDESVDVTDSYAGFLGTCDAGDAPCMFYYTRTVTADPLFCGSFTVDNTAEFETNDTGATGQDSVSVTIDVPCLLLGCTPGFWQGGAGSQLWNEPDDPQWVYGGSNPFIHTTVFNDFFNSVTDPRLDGQTMMQIVSNENGIANVAEKAARDMVAAYLNEASFPSDFPAVSLAALEAEWYAAVAGGDSGLAAFHTKWAGINEPPEGGYCPLP